MTAAKGMDVIARLRGGANETSKVRNVQIFGYVDHDTSGPNIGPTLKTQSFLLNEICVVTQLPKYCGKDTLQKRKYL